MAIATSFPEFWTQAQIEQYKATAASLEAQGKTMPDPWWVSSPEWMKPGNAILLPAEEIQEAKPFDQSIIAEGIDTGVYVSADPEIKTGEDYMVAVGTDLVEQGKSEGELLKMGFDLGIIGTIFSTIMTGVEVVETVQDWTKTDDEITTQGGTEVTTGLLSNGTAIGGVYFGGPGVPEPPAGMVAKAWKTKAFSNTVGEYWVYHWILIDGRRATYNAAKKQVKIWRPKKNITLGPRPRVKDLIKINRSVNRLNTKLKKQLKKAKVEL